MQEERQVVGRGQILLETQNSTLAITTGLVFLADYVFDGSLYTRFPDTYRFMQFWPTFIWGFIYILAGCIHLYTLARHKQEMRKTILLIKSALWVFLGVCVVTGDLYAASGWFYFIFATFAIISYWKIRWPVPPHYEITHTDATHLT